MEPTNLKLISVSQVFLPSEGCLPCSVEVRRGSNKLSSLAGLFGLRGTYWGETGGRGGWICADNWSIPSSTKYLHVMVSNSTDQKHWQTISLVLVDTCSSIAATWYIAYGIWTVSFEVDYYLEQGEADSCSKSNGSSSDYLSHGKQNPYTVALCICTQYECGR